MVNVTKHGWELQVTSYELQVAGSFEWSRRTLVRRGSCRAECSSRFWIPTSVFTLFGLTGFDHALDSAQQELRPTSRGFRWPLFSLCVCLRLFP
jgi:hypothetical protein